MIKKKEVNTKLQVRVDRPGRNLGCSSIKKELTRCWIEERTKYSIIVAIWEILVIGR